MTIHIAIIGRPNVGKSSLFNRLTKTNNALVDNFSGLTRDRLNGIINIHDQKIILTDTGGIIKPNTQLETLIVKQTWNAIYEAQIILFIVDAKNGIHSIDIEISNKLRALNKRVLLIINKIDGKNQIFDTADFYCLGITPLLAISASNNIGIEYLFNLLTNILPNNNQKILEDEKPKTKVAFIGCPNVGKSTLVNYILKNDRVIAHHIPGTTRDSVSIPFKYRDNDYIIIDTAGTRRKRKIFEKIEKFSFIKTTQVIRDSNIVILIIDAVKNFSDQDLKLLSFIIDYGKPFIIAINKCDMISLSVRERIKEHLLQRLVFIKFVKLYFISAINGKGITYLLDNLNIMHNNLKRKISTSEVNKILQMALNNHFPAMHNGLEIKLRYAHIGQNNPLTIIIHGIRVNYITDNYYQYLVNFYRKELNLINIPLKIIFKNYR